VAAHLAVNALIGTVLVRLARSWIPRPLNLLLAFCSSGRLSSAAKLGRIGGRSCNITLVSMAAPHPFKQFWSLEFVGKVVCKLGTEIIAFGLPLFTAVKSGHQKAVDSWFGTPLHPTGVFWVGWWGFFVLFGVKGATGVVSIAETPRRLM